MIKGTEIKGSDTATKGSSELDSIRSINNQKGVQRIFQDSISPSTSGASGSSGANSGKDSTEAPSATPDKDFIINGDDTLTLSQTQIDGLIRAGVKQAMQAQQQELRELKDKVVAAERSAEELQRKANEERDALEQQIAAEKKQKNSLATVFTNLGFAAPTGSEEDSYKSKSSYRPLGTDHRPGDLRREYTRILEDRDATPASSWFNSSTGEGFLQRDTKHSDRFLREHRDGLRQGMEQLARDSGLLRGKSSSFLVKDAATLQANIPPAFLDYLSATLRTTHSPKFVFHQFANHKLELGKGPGEDIQVARVAHAIRGTRKSDWRLTPGIPIVDTSQALNATSVRISLEMWGMGKDTNMPPIGIPEFIMSTSLLDLEQALNQNIGHNYNEFQDIALREMWFATTRVVYNSNDSVTASPGDLTAGSNGRITEEFLNELYAYLCGQQIPAYSNGKYGLLLNSNALAQMKNSLGKKYRFTNPLAIEEVTNIFNAATKSEQEKIDGYEGDVANFMVFSTNAISLGAAGTLGAQTEALGAGARVTRTSFAFGADTIAEAIGMPMQLRMDPNTNFGTLKRYTWVSHAGYGALDVDPAINPPDSNSQQLRVVALHTTDVEL